MFDHVEIMSVEEYVKFPHELCLYDKKYMTWREATVPHLGIDMKALSNLKRDFI